MSKQREAGVNVGVDVGKQSLDVVIHERGLHFTVANDAAGIRSLLGRLRRYRLARIVVEATGRLEYALVLAAAERGWPIIVSQPLIVRRYAAAKGVLAKTDKIDATILADYAAVMRPPVRPLAIGKIREIKDLTAQTTARRDEHDGEESPRHHAQGTTGRHPPPRQSSEGLYREARPRH